MAKKWPIIALLVIGIAAILFATWQEFKGALPAVLPPEGDIEKEIAEGDIPLELPEGFEIEIFAKDVPGARVLVGPDQLGNYWLSQMSEGVISTLEIGGNGQVERVYPVFQNLKNPHGLVLDDEGGIMLYFAEEDKISRARLYTDAPVEKIADLPQGGRHVSRTLGIGPDGRLYVSIGSSCDVCEENVDERAVIWHMNKDGTQKEVFARGLRNAVFFEWDPVDGKMWATEMGRDFLGDNLPPDEVNIVEEGNHYGWPFCFGEMIRDNTFAQGRVPNDFCGSTIGSHIDIQAHSAPLGLAFIPEEGWPEDMRLDLLVAYHGSWNRSDPTGYKIVRFDLNEEREVTASSDFIAGWLKDNDDVLGRPVDLLAQPGGTLFITDDKAGVVYRLTRNSTD